MDSDQPKDSDTECPVCGKYFSGKSIEAHVNRCIFLNSHDEPTVPPSKEAANKRSFSIFAGSQSNSTATSSEVLVGSGATAKKKSKTTLSTATANTKIGSPSSSSSYKAFQTNPSLTSNTSSSPDANNTAKPMAQNSSVKSIPLAEKMRPETIENYIGQSHVMAKNAILRKILDKNEIPSMILWGPPGVGKTTLAHIIANRCKQTQNARFVKLSATMAGVNDIKTAVTAAKNELKFGRKTILFMDEIHRFNKLQQVLQFFFSCFAFKCLRNKRKQ